MSADIKTVLTDAIIADVMAKNINADRYEFAKAIEAAVLAAQPQAGDGAKDAEGNYAVINGKVFPVKFEGYDRLTYKHSPGCLAERNPHDCCCCNALGRATAVWSASIPGIVAIAAGKHNRQP